MKFFFFVRPTRANLVLLLAPYALRVTVCARLPEFHTAEENPPCIFTTLFDHLKSFWRGTGECISPANIFNDILFKIAVRSDRLCILVTGLLDAFCHCLQFAKNPQWPSS